jgi:phosphoserine phosphatase
MTFANNEATMLVVFDVDSTLIEQEVIELLAAKAGKAHDVADVTERAMRGELDFTSSLRARVETIRGMPISILEEVLNEIRITKGAIELIEYIHAQGGKAAAVSGGFIELLEPLAKTLKLDFFRANVLEVENGHFTGDVIPPVIDKPAKAQALREWAEQLNLSLDRTVAIGDGANDLDMMAIAGVSIGFNPKPRVREAAQFCIESGNLFDAVSLLPKN